MLATAGIFLLATALTTAAVFRDNAFLGMGDVITSKPFSIGLVGQNNRVQQIGADSTSYTFDGKDFLPGATHKVSVRVFNNSPETQASLGMSVKPVAGVLDDLSGFVRVSASVNGSTVFGNPASPTASTQLTPATATNVVTLDSRGRAQLANGDTWVAGTNANSSVVVDLWFTFKDDLTTTQKRSLNGAAPSSR
ncbi:hypothetical protein G7066_12650 [Leucobacter coleopterorum]|uniref:SipW-cognate class signal peptide n=1 Tax=Leucobacter coleopterorum TaxID=2714933 RepID=A0ABX6JY15_9MICO|nr:hypothetical protein [Leucobacter coleopterorum]QIM19206.1 hypothetical protein G7066_12650 [Leucobacter coleopterorum]